MCGPTGLLPIVSETEHPLLLSHEPRASPQSCHSTSGCRQVTDWPEMNPQCQRLRLHEVHSRSSHTGPLGWIWRVVNGNPEALSFSHTPMPRPLPIPPLPCTSRECRVGWRPRGNGRLSPSQPRASSESPNCFVLQLSLLKSKGPIPPRAATVTATQNDHFKPCCHPPPRWQ